MTGPDKVVEKMEIPGYLLDLHVIVTIHVRVGPGMFRIKRDRKGDPNRFILIRIG